MARFSGLVGFVTLQRTAPGVSSEVVVERGPYFGDVKRASLSQNNDTSVNSEIRVSNTIEIVADEFVNDNAFAIRFVVWAGVAWEVVTVTLEHPRLQLLLGGVYHGDRAAPAELPDGP